MEILSFLLFILLCIMILGVIYGLFRLLLYFGRSDGDEFRDLRCSQCQTQRKPIKTGVVRNLVEIELRCPVSGVRPRFLGYSSENEPFYPLFSRRFDKLVIC